MLAQDLARARTQTHTRAFMLPHTCLTPIPFAKRNCPSLPQNLFSSALQLMLVLQRNIQRGRTDGNREMGLLKN